jgi:aldehyde:ferredoxin oxidoreductase
MALAAAGVDMEISNTFIDIDLSTGTVETVTITPEDRRLYLGGKGLALKLLYDRMEPGVDPLSEKNSIAFFLGVLLGTGAPCSGRWSGVTKSPLTGIFTSSSCGGPFGMALKTAGFDGLIITGKADAPVYIEITDENVLIKEGTGLWGKTTSETHAALGLGEKDGACVIGPAGEHKVLYANIASGHRFLGRGGMGAVFGSKKLKAVVARGGTYTINPKRKAKFEQVKKKALGFIKQNEFTSDHFRNYGTAYNVGLCNENGLLPVHNFRGRNHPQADAVSGQRMAEQYQTKPWTCRPCSILCGHKGTDKNGGEHKIPEYETVGLIGPNLGIFDPDFITEVNDLCGEMGMDTISTGGTLGYVMEAGEKKLLNTALKFGSTTGILRQVRSIAYRRGRGREYADGSRRLAERYGGKEFAIQVKGLELSAYHPGSAWGQALSYAVANRGGCHLSAYPVSLECLYGLIKPLSKRAKPDWVVFFENLYNGINSLHTCAFTAFAYLMEPAVPKYVPKFLLRFSMTFFPNSSMKMMDWSVYSNFFESVTGVPCSKNDFIRAGKRIHLLERYMNAREGVAKKDDTLPERFLTPQSNKDGFTPPVPLEELLNAYYKKRKYSKIGIPRSGELRKMGITVKQDDRERIMEKLAGYKEIKPGKNPIASLYIQVMMWIVGRAFTVAPSIDERFGLEMDTFPPGFIFGMRVWPDGPRMVLKKTEIDKWQLLRRNRFFETVDLEIQFKSVTDALVVFTFKEHTARAFASNRMVVKGDLPFSLAVVRSLSLLEQYLLPRFLAKRAVKRIQPIPFFKKQLRRLILYTRIVLG